MKILISNDDGIYAKGLNYLSQAMSEFGDIVIIAPDRNRSGASNSLTLENPIRVETLDSNRFAVKGTPTDCIHYGLNKLMTTWPDIVVSGINHGANLGDDVIYSGTVAAATEGRHMGLPAVAISLVGDQHFETAAYYAALIVRQLKHHPLPSDQILNVNVPDLPLSAIQGIQVTRLGNRYRDEKMIEEKDPRGKPVYWIGPPGAKQDAGEGTDFYAIDRGYVSVTPMKVDMTAYETMQTLTDWLTEIQ